MARARKIKTEGKQSRFSNGEVFAGGKFRRGRLWIYTKGGGRCEGEAFGSLKFICKINTSTRIKLIHCNFAPFQATSRSGDWQKLRVHAYRYNCFWSIIKAGEIAPPPPPPPPPPLPCPIKFAWRGTNERTNEARPNFRTTSIPLGCKHIVKGIMASVATRAAK